MLAAEVELFKLLECDLLNQWATLFVDLADLGVMHMRFTVYTPSVQALASILASRSMLEMEPIGAPELVTLYGATSVQETGVAAALRGRFSV